MVSAVKIHAVSAVTKITMLLYPQSQCFASKIVFQTISEFNESNWFPLDESIDALIEIL